MALNFIEKIREAETESERHISLSEINSKATIEKSEKEAELLLDIAEKDSKNIIDKREIKALKLAEEIIVTAKNKAKLEVEKLRTESFKKQDKVNKEILKLIV